MESIDLQSMSLDELWALHETICLILARKLEAEKRSLEQGLNELRPTFKKASDGSTSQRQPYPKVHPKFRNPERPHQTWSGRGHQPRWVRELLAAEKPSTIYGFQLPQQEGGDKEPKTAADENSTEAFGCDHRKALSRITKAPR